MRCIEIYQVELQVRVQVLSNRHMRCIEMKLLGSTENSAIKSNRHMRCIEIKAFDLLVKKKDDRTDT